MLEYNREDHWTREDAGNYASTTERLLKEKLESDALMEQLAQISKDDKSNFGTE